MTDGLASRVGMILVVFAVLILVLVGDDVPQARWLGFGSLVLGAALIVLQLFLRRKRQ